MVHNFDKILERHFAIGVEIMNVLLRHFTQKTRINIFEQKISSTNSTFQDVIFNIFLTKTREALPPGDILASYTVHSKTECSLKCLQKGTCIGYNYRPESTKYAENCQLRNKTQEGKKGIDGEWTFWIKM